ncbi:dihydroorotate dehydrogenase electron transfer subunit [candidate division WOR-3 bacterium]|nr:dihydroorotate dehydrogenase electron transfer subunit [candidate division WOR-3 bacterium]
MINWSMGQVVEVARVGAEIYSVWISERKISRKVKPGQFIGVKVPERDDLLLRRPFSVADVKGGKMRIVFRVVGAGTAKLAHSKKGDRWDIIGPLGKPAPLVQNKSVVVCGGGVGAAPLFYLTRVLKEKNRVVAVLGARRAAELVMVSEFRQLGVKVYLTTEDGSKGIRGLVTEALEPVIKVMEKPVVYACGPEGMLKALCPLSRKAKVWAFFEERMGCGTGVCYGCALPKKDGGYLRLCQDGPVVSLDEVVL